MFIRHVYDDAPFKWTLLEGAKGVQLAEAGLQSWKERCWIDVPAVEGVTQCPPLNLPVAGGRLAPYTTRPAKPFPAAAPPFNRVAYAAAHVVADPLADNDPWLTPAIDWDRTIAFRKYLWSLGLGVAEAMDTAQRGMGLDWPTSLELIRRSLEAAKHVPGARDRLGRRHRPSRSGPGRDRRRCHPGLRGADALRSRSSAAASS